MAVLSICTAFLFACGEEGGVHHTHEYTWFMVRQASCTTEGSLEGLCSCGEKTYEIIPKSHMMNNDGVCILCGEVDNASHAHEWVWTETLRPKCDENGLSVATCYCGATNMKTEPALGHSYGWDGICTVCGQGAANLGSSTLEYGRDEFKELIQAYYGNNILNSSTTKVSLSNLKIDAFGNFFMDIKYGYAEEERIIYGFNLSGTKVDYDITVPSNISYVSEIVLGENYFDAYGDDNDVGHWINGYEGYGCSITHSDGSKKDIGTLHMLLSQDTVEEVVQYWAKVSGLSNEKVEKSLLTNVFINKDNLLVAVYADKSLNVLGKIPTTNENLEKSKYAFVKMQNGEMAFAGILDKAQKEIVIPPTHQGKPVSIIFSQTISKNNTIYKVTVPNSVKLVANHAFASCANLKGVVFQGDLDKLGRESFINCPSLEYVVLGKVRVMNNFVFENTNIFLTEYTEIPSNWVYWQDNCKVYCKGEWSYVNGVPTPNK